jgi:beta-N-acetylhexosaminidase
MKALARALVGEVNPSGRLPVNVPRLEPGTAALYPLGHGLSYGP